MLWLLLSLDYATIKEAYHKSYTYEAKGRYEDAIKAMMVVYEAYPDAYTPNLRLGWLYYLAKKYANSEYHYKKAIKAAPYSVEAKLGLTLPYMAQGRWKRVEGTTGEILKTDYYNYYANLRLCYALRHQKKYSQAEKVARKMLTLYPTDVSFLNELALALYYQGKKNDALAIFADVLILDPDNATARSFLK
ncbi:MAG: tetratricopeptide repeat protein [Thermotogae bacterium]|nr:tetratricopeptide repeat protein [Thermotogota bacterium]